MNKITYEQAALFEHKFWLQVLGDHARFIMNALSPKETELINKSRQFITGFDQLLEQVRRPLPRPEMEMVTRQAYQYAMEIRQFKLEIIKRHLVEEISIELPPTFINHMVNEVEEYLRILGFLLQGQAAPFSHPLNYHLIWLLDAAGHAGAIHDSLDAVEKRLKEKSSVFVEHFSDLFIKSWELYGYLRTSLNQFPALNRLNLQSEKEILLFMALLTELLELEQQNAVLGTLFPLLLDHMFREECYYLTKLSFVSEVKNPNCDPTKPRINAKS